MLSVIIPVYNREKLIIETLDTILKQEYKNIECILIDDFSTDNTVRVIQRFIHSDDRFKLVKKADLNSVEKGANSARNIGLMGANGKYTMFLDSDDLLYPGSIQKFIKVLEDQLDLDFVVGQAKGFWTLPGDSDLCWNRLNKNIDDLVRFVCMDMPWGISSVIYRTDYLIKNKLLFDNELPNAQDLEFHIRILTTKPKYLKLNEVDFLVYIRKSNDDVKISNKKDFDRYFRNKFIAVKKILNVLNHIQNIRIRRILQKYFYSNTVVGKYHLLGRNDTYKDLNPKIYYNLFFTVIFHLHNFLYRKIKFKKGNRHIIKFLTFTPAGLTRTHWKIEIPNS